MREREKERERERERGKGRKREKGGFEGGELRTDMQEKQKEAREGASCKESKIGP